MKKVRTYPEGRVPYGKTSSNEDALVALLSNRGLKWEDEAAIRSVLRTIGYYRLTGYLHPFRKEGSETYRENANLDLVWRLYSFDRRMRLVIADALARIEISLRARIVDVHTAAHDGDPFVYAKPEALPKFSPSRFEKFLKGITDAVNRAEGEDEPAVVHFRRTYNDEHLPIWTAMEYLSFGDVTTYYEGLLPELKEKISNTYGISPGPFVGWLRTLRRLRNICAHHGRIWNRKLNTRISYTFDKVEGLKDLWDCVVPNRETPYTTVYTALSLCAWLIRVIRPESKWTSRVKELLADYPEVPLVAMGFPADWQKFALWKEPDEEKEEDEAADSDKDSPPGD